VIVIGAGIAGLSAGCYAQMNGYRAQIFEMHDRPGGLCTSWQRKGYTINGCIHLLLGCEPRSDFYQIWEELGAIQGRQIVNHEEFIRFEGTDGRTFVLYSNIDRLEEHMLELAPEDYKLVKELIKAVRMCTRFKLPPILKAPELYGPIDGLELLSKMLPHAGLIRKWLKVSMRDFAVRFRKPVLREAFSSMWFPEVPVLFILMTLSLLHEKAIGYPLGGSLEFSRAIERRYLDLGGQFHYGTRVSKIVVENSRAVAIRLEDGSEHRADFVISAADGYSTIFDMLAGKYANKKIRSYYQRLPIFPPLIYIALGISRSFEPIPGSTTGLNFPLEKPIAIAGQELDRLGIRVHNFDPTLAPSGKTLARVMIPSNFSYWQSLSEDLNSYHAEKGEIGDRVLGALDRRFSGLSHLVEMRDVATPITYHRYTGNWQGSHQGWLVTPQTWKFRMKKNLPGLDNFYLAGQWVEPGGGVPSAAMSGRNVIQLLCKRDRKPFVTT
jgi:phytoene dehydrogenase-like protein